MMPSLADNQEAYENQIRSMRKDGKETAEIIDFFHNTYKIKLRAREVFGICHKKPEHERIKLEPEEKRRMKKKSRLGYNHDSKFVAHIYAAYRIHQAGFIGRVEKVLQGER